MKRPSSYGFTYIALLVAITIIGISLGATGKYWSNVILREKEAELLYRGDQYRNAIKRYYFAIPGRMRWPQSIDNLLVDEQTGTGKRHLRQKYKDPITGEDFGLIRNQLQGNGIIGVYSTSEKEPLKQSNFSIEDKDFEGKKKYNEWKFVFTVQPGQK